MSARHCGVAAGLAKLSPPILTLQLARAGPGLCPMEIAVRERRASCSSLKEQRKMFQGGGRKNLGEKKDISEELEVQEGFFLLYDDGGEDSEKEDSGYFVHTGMEEGWDSLLGKGEYIWGGGGAGTNGGGAQITLPGRNWHGLSRDLETRVMVTH